MVHPTVPLVRQGQDVARIVTPAHEPWAGVAQGVVDLIASWTGVRVPYVTPVLVIERDGPLLSAWAKEKSLLFIGNLADNIALFEPYMRRLLVVDEVSPGGPILQTYSNPWGNGAGLVAVGGSQAGDAQAALEMFERHARPHAAEGELSLPRLWLPGPDRLSLAAARYARLARPRGEPWFPGLGDAGAFHLGYENGRQLHEAAAIADLGLFNEEQVHDIEQRLLEVALLVPGRVWWFCSPGARNGAVGGRHENFKNTRLLHLVEHLLHVGRPNVAARCKLEEIRRQIHQYYDHVLAHAYRNDHEGVEESMGWQCVLWHALTFGRWHHFETGRALEAARHLFLSTDNFGGAAVHAQYGGVEQPNHPTDLRDTLRVVAWRLRDGRLRWLHDNMPYCDARHYSFPLNVPLDGVIARRPDEWLGVQSQPISDHSYETSLADARWKQPGISREESADIVVFRDGFAPADQYLALDAFQNQFQPLGLASVLRYVDQGKLWLVAHTGAEGNYEKSGLAVSRGVVASAGRADVGEPWGAAVAHGQDERFGYAALRCVDYHDTDWTRWVLWHRGRCFVFLDVVDARKPGPYALTVCWRTLHPAHMEGRRWVQRVDGLVCSIEPARPMFARASRGSESQYQHERVPFLLRQGKVFPASRGDERSCIANLVCTRDAGAALPEIRSLADHVAIVRDGDELVVYGVGAWRQGPLEVDASVFILTSDTVRVAQGTVRWHGRVLVKSDGANQFNGAPAPEIENADWPSLLEPWWESAAPPDAQDETEVATSAAQVVQWSCDGFKPHSTRLQPHRTGGRLTSGDWRDSPGDGKPRKPHGVDWFAEFDGPVEVGAIVAALAPERIVGGEGWPEFGARQGEPEPIVVDGQTEAQIELQVDGQRRRGRLDRRVIGPTGKSCYRTQHVIRYEGGAMRRIDVRLGDGLPLRELEIHGPTDTPAAIVELRPFASDGNTMLARTADHQLLCVDAAGVVRWHRAFDHPLLAMAVMEGEAGRMLALSDAACGQWWIDGDGQVRKHHQLDRCQDARAFFHQGITQNRVYSIGDWRRPGQAERSLFLGCYQSVAWLDADDALHWLPSGPLDAVGRRGHAWRGLIYWDRVLERGCDLNGDGVEDQAMLGRGYATVPSLVLFDGRTLKPYAEHPLPNGTPLHLSVDHRDGKLAVMAVNTLAAMVCDGDGTLRWRRAFDTPAAAAAVHAGELFICKDDGIMLRLDRQGQVVAQAMWTPGFTDIAVTGQWVCAAGAQGVRLARHDWMQARTFDLPACRVMAVDGGGFAVATLDGRLALLRP